MLNKRGFKAEQSIDLSKLRGLFSGLILKAFADEGGDGGDEGGEKSPQINFETLIANARKEEKEKLYPRIKKLEDENKALVQTNNDTLLRLATVQKELDELKANKGENQKIKDLEKELETLKAENVTLKESTPKEEEIRNQIKAEYEVKLYRTEKLNENKDSILSVFVDEVSGNTKEEIDASITKVITKTVDTKKQLGLVDEDGNPITPKKKEEKDPKKAPTKPPVANPNDGADGEEFDLDYVRNLDPRSAEYQEFRKKMGLK